MLFSATMPQDIVKIATSHMKLPVRVEVAPAGTASERVEQELFIVDKAKKRSLLATILASFPNTVLVFTRTKHGARQTCKAVQDMGHTAAEIHSNRSLAQRRQALDGFKSGRYRVLVATDIAARGIDVKGIGLVINMDLPDNAEDYVHRIGRTGRAGQTGKAISFATPDQRDEIRAIERLIRNRLNVSRLPEKLVDVPLPPKPTTTTTTSSTHTPRPEHRSSQQRSFSERPRGEHKNRGLGRFVDRGVKTRGAKARPGFNKPYNGYQASIPPMPDIPRSVIADDEDEQGYRYEPKSNHTARKPQSRGQVKSERK